MKLNQNHIPEIHPQCFFFFRFFFFSSAEWDISTAREPASLRQYSNKASPSTSNLHVGGVGSNTMLKVSAFTITGAFSLWNRVANPGASLVALAYSALQGNTLSTTQPPYVQS